MRFKRNCSINKKELVKLWNKRFYETNNYMYRYARPASQHIRRIINTENDLIEVIKYEAKIFTNPTMKK